MRNVYERFVRPLLFSFKPEAAHHFALACLQATSRIDLALKALQRFQPPPKTKALFGLNFPNPIGLAAGFDKNGVAIPAWAALGFGFIEIGTVTAKPQPGNPKPRIFRFCDQAALINRLGFNNDGADAISDRLANLRGSGRWPKIPVGISIGKSRATPLEHAAADYLYSFRRLNALADYAALNISSPNTPGLRELQSREQLSILLDTLRAENSTKPLIVKIAPDISPDKLDEIISVCEQHQVSGIIATNTTLDHSSIPPAKDQSGGLSGAPLRQKSTAFVRAITSKSAIPVIASGGVMDAQSGREKIDAGAQLLQIYTGYIFRGPDLLREIVEQL
jgi:dihydroorotate dehydrogenase